MAQVASKSLTTTQNNGSMTLSTLIDTKEIQDTITKTLGKARTQTFIGSALTVAQSPNLKDVEPNSLFNCLLKSATYNFPIDPAIGMAYPVPYKDKDGNKIAQFQLGAKGILELALRTNKYKRLNVKEVKSTELVGIDFFGEEQIKWDNSPNREKLPTVGYMAAFELTNGMTKRIYWNNEKILEHANRYSKAHQNALKYKDTSNDLWSQNFDAMARKTVLKALISQFGPKSLELQNAFQFDQAEIKRKNGVETAVYVDSTDTVSSIDENKVFDIDPATGELIGEPTDNTPFATPEEAPSAEIIPEENEDEVKVIFYGEYLENKDKYQKEDYPDGREAYQNVGGKKTIRVRIKK